VIIKSVRITALVLFIVIGGSVFPIMGQQTSQSKIPPLRVINYSGDMTSLLAYLSQEFSITIGLEIDPKQLKPQVSIHVKDATLTDVLNAIVKSAPAYHWRERDGWIEVLPVEGSHPFLDTMINNFQVNDVNQKEAVNHLLSLLDLQANLRSMGLTRKDPPSTSETKIEKLSVKIEGVTVRQALSMIANQSRARFWLFRTLGGGFFSISNSPM
jgi:hypothetical protein